MKLCTISAAFLVCVGKAEETPVHQITERKKEVVSLPTL